VSSNGSDATSELFDSDGAAARLMREICEWCVEVLHVDGALVTVMSANGGRVLLYASDATAQELDDLQFSLGEGPCLTAFDDVRPALEGDLASDGALGRWPMFVGAAMDTGVGAAFAFPLLEGLGPVGTLELYRRDAGDLDARQLPDLELAVARLSNALLARRAEVVDGDELAGMGERSAGRIAVHCAAGMVSVQMGTTVDEGLSRLRAAAFAEDVALTEVAHSVLRRVRRFTADLAPD
jgi:hypothetical protein